MSHGYVMVQVAPHRYRTEHRVLMEKKIGRALRAGEVVHHRNEIRSDNRLSNLVLYSSNAEHMRAHAAAKRSRRCPK